MDWLANNCYSCDKLGDSTIQHNPNCELEPIISHAPLDKEIDEDLVLLITKKKKLCKCKNFIRTASRFTALLIMVLTLSGCASKVTENKVYRHKVSFYKHEPLKFLYIEIEHDKLPEEYYKINFWETLTAENKLQTHILRRLNNYEKSFIPIAEKELQKFRRFTAKLKEDITKLNKYSKELQTLKIRLESIRKRIDKINKIGGEK